MRKFAVIGGFLSRFGGRFGERCPAKYDRKRRDARNSGADVELEHDADQ
jgi:hypothetical protein